MQVMHDRVLVKKIEPVNVTASGFVLPSLPDETFKATVIKVGNGRPIEGGGNMPMSVAEGDVVIYNPNATISVVVEGEKLLVIKEEDIFAIVDGE